MIHYEGARFVYVVIEGAEHIVLLLYQCSESDRICLLFLVVLLGYHCGVWFLAIACFLQL